MAVARRCDICASYYEYYRTIEDPDINFNSIDLCILRKYETMTPDTHNMLDLCPKCANHIKETIEILMERANFKSEGTTHKKLMSEVTKGADHE